MGDFSVVRDIYKGGELINEHGACRDVTLKLLNCTYIILQIMPKPSILNHLLLALLICMLGSELDQ